MARTLSDVERVLGPDTLAERREVAERDAVALDEVLAMMAEGASRSAAIRAVLPDRPVATMLRRLREYEAGGRDALVSRRFAVRRKVTDEVRGALRALALADPTASAEVLAERISRMFGITVRDSAVQVALKELGLARPRGRPWWRTAEPATDATEAPQATVEPLALAGAELLKAVDIECGAVRALTEVMGHQLAMQPEPQGEIADDRADRDELGRFLPSYNTPEPRTEPELGARFDSVEAHRATKDLREMRVVQESPETRYRKNLALVMLPCVVRSSRWSELEHWRGEQLEELVGFAYQASTLDKYVRELKYAGCGDAARDGVASFWLRLEGEVVDEPTGAISLYVDAATKPVWTHHWTRAAPVSKNGRVMPATTTMMLNSGAGTPLLYRSYSGHASLPAELVAFLDEYEVYAGEGMARRVVVIDREGHTIALFKALHPRWGFIVPLKRNVLGPNAKFEEVGEWSAYGAGPDEVCDGFLWLNDNRPGQDALRIRVVGRRRHRTGNVAWFGTMLLADEFSANDVIRLYFERWPLQEHVFRDGNGAVGLDVHHGYGKRKIDNVGVIDREEKLQSQIRRCEAQIVRHQADLAESQAEVAHLQEALDTARPSIDRDRDTCDAAIASGDLTADIRRMHATLRTWEGWVGRTQKKLDDASQRGAKAQDALAAAEANRRRKSDEVERLSTQRRIFTMDVELDEIMTAMKLTFMNLGHRLMAEYLDLPLELETLIEAVLTLPGERVVTAQTETIRIYRRDRDKRVMEAVERACERLTARALRRGKRLLRFELAAPPRHDRSDPRPART